MASPARGCALPIRTTDGPDGRSPRWRIRGHCCGMCSFLAFHPKGQHSLRFALGFGPLGQMCHDPPKLPVDCHGPVWTGCGGNRHPAPCHGLRKGFRNSAKGAKTGRDCPGCRLSPSTDLDSVLQRICAACRLVESYPPQQRAPSVPLLRGGGASVGSLPCGSDFRSPLARAKQTQTAGAAGGRSPGCVACRCPGCVAPPNAGIAAWKDRVI